MVPVEATCESESGKRGTPACFAGFAEARGNEEFDGIGFWGRTDVRVRVRESDLSHTDSHIDESMSSKFTFDDAVPQQCIYLHIMGGFVEASACGASMPRLSRHSHLARSRACWNISRS